VYILSRTKYSTCGFGVNRTVSVEKIIFLRVVVRDTVVGEGVAEGIVLGEIVVKGYNRWRSVTEGQYRESLSGRYSYWKGS
jgi:hypothetical protein